MRAMILDAPNQRLRLADVPSPVPNSHQVLIQVHTCGICRTDLHIVDGELTNSKLPLIPGHQIVGTVVKTGEQVTNFRVGERVGVPWLVWRERILRSVANLTRQDGEEFLALAPHIPIHTEVEAFPLTAANEALDALRSGKIKGAAVLIISE